MLPPEIEFAQADANDSRRLNRRVRAGELRKLLPRVYTSNLLADDAFLVKKHLHLILARLFPGSLYSHRSALEFGISPQGNLYLTGSQRRVYRWPGVTVRIAAGPPPLPDDHPLYPNLYASSLERACLENLQSSRTVDGERRTVDQAVVEDRLLVHFNTRGEEGLQRFRDRATEIAVSFGWTSELQRLQKIIGALLASQPATILQSPAATALALGEPYDTGRVALFRSLAATLLKQDFPFLPAKTNTPKQYAAFAFFESYFSNYIEGTVFEVEEARSIIQSGSDISNRHADSHDIRGTYHLVADPKEMQQVPANPDMLIHLLQRRHAVLLGGRPDKRPGLLKKRVYRAGDTVFVHPDQVRGTLREGFHLLGSLAHPFARALYLMFLIAEVHPFADGNGRIARVMMNAELSAGGQTKLIIPTVYRTDYLLNLRKLSRQQQAEGYVRMMLRAWQYSHWIEPTNLDDMEDQFRRTNAFRDSDEAALIFPV